MIAQLVNCRVNFTALVMSRIWVSFADFNPSKFALFVRLWWVRCLQLSYLVKVILNYVMRVAWRFSVVQ